MAAAKTAEQAAEASENPAGTAPTAAEEEAAYTATILVETVEHTAAGAADSARKAEIPHLIQAERWAARDIPKTEKTTPAALARTRSAKASCSRVRAPEVLGLAVAEVAEATAETAVPAAIKGAAAEEATAETEETMAAVAVVMAAPAAIKGAAAAVTVLTETVGSGLATQAVLMAGMAVQQPAAERLSAEHPAPAEVALS